jgi:hypothetical protein
MITRFGVSDEEGGTASLRRAAQELERVESSDLGWASRLRELSDDVRAAVDEDPLEGLAGVSREFYDMISPRESVVEAAGTRRGRGRRQRGDARMFAGQVPSWAELRAGPRRGMGREISRTLATVRYALAYRYPRGLETQVTDRGRMLSCSGMGAMAFTVAPPTLLADVNADTYRIAVRRALGIMEPLAVGLTACPCCGTGMDESHIAGTLLFLDNYPCFFREKSVDNF